VNLLVNLDAGFLQGILFVFLKLSSKSGEIDGKLMISKGELEY